jgi:hypothetical protein
LTKLKQVGWAIWHQAKPLDQSFTRTALTISDRKCGYRGQPIYIKEDERDAK